MRLISYNCEICFSLPHKRGCPNVETPPIVHYCSECKEPIYDQELFYRIGKDKYCENCIDDFKEYAEKEDYYYDDET